MVALGGQSLFWQVDGQQRQIWLQYTNMTDWSFALNLSQTNSSVISVGSTTNLCSVNESNCTSIAYAYSHNYAPMNQFMFGEVYNKTHVSFSNLTDLDYQPNAAFSSIESGMMLSPNLYLSFVNKMNIITKFQVDCGSELTSGSICVLQGSCDQWSHILQYQFRFAFQPITTDSSVNSEARNITVPLINFAVSQADSCELIVTNKLTNFDGSTMVNDVILGNMFYQAVEAKTALINGSQPSIQLRVSQHNQLTNGTVFQTTIANNEDQVDGPSSFQFYQPIKFDAQINSAGLLLVNSSISNRLDSYSTYFIDTNATTSYFWTTDCDYQGNNCSLAPINAVEYTNINEGEWPYLDNTTDTIQTGGYQLTGQKFETYGYLQNGYLGKTQVHVPQVSEYLAVLNIDETSWLYDIQLSSGALAFNAQSDLLIQTANYIDGDKATIRWLVQLGNVNDYSYINSSRTETQPQVYIGGSAQNYTDLLQTMTTSLNNFTMSPDQFGNFDVSSFEFGYIQGNTKSTEQFITPNQTVPYQWVEKAALNFNYQGVGLPFRYWSQFVQYLQRTSEEVEQDLVCDPSEGGICELKNNCAYYKQNTNLFELSFQIWFGSDYTVVPLGLFSQNNDTSCKLFIQSVNGTDTDPSRVILGTQFLQAFNVYYTNTLQTDTQTYKVELMLSESNQNCLPATIGRDVNMQTTASPFQYFPTYEIEVFQDGMDLFVNADVGYQGMNQMRYSLQDYVILTQQQFDFTNYVDVAPTNIITRNNGQEYIQTKNYTSIDTCVQAISSNQVNMCTLPGGEVNFITDYNWTYFPSTSQNLIGLSYTSPIWYPQRQLGYPAQVISIAYSNLTKWDWLPNDQQYNPPQLTQNITLSNITNTDSSTNQTNVTLSNYRQSLQMFGFGVQYPNENTCYFKELSTASTPTVATFSTLETGLVLSPDLYETFIANLKILTTWTVTCTTQDRGQCILPLSCSDSQNQDLWAYQFRFSFTEAVPARNVTVPLSLFAYNNQLNQCVLEVIRAEYDYLGNPLLNEAIFGNMLYQSVWLQIVSYSPNQQSAILQLNNYSNGTQMAAQIANNSDQQAGQNCFVIYPPYGLQAEIDQTTLMPVVMASVNDQESFQSFYININTDVSFVWGDNCTINSNVSSNQPACSSQPVYAQETDTSGWSSALVAENKVQNTGGYLLEGNTYSVYTRLQSSQYTLQTTLYNKESIYQSVDKVGADSWLYNINAQSGQLAFGASSTFLTNIVEVFFTYDTISWLIDTGNVKDYSWINPTAQNGTVQLEIGATDSNLTQLMNDLTLTPKQNLTLQSAPNGTFGVQDFSFGIYYDSSNAEYFEQITVPDMIYPSITNAAINFNYMGIGLPTRFYIQVYQYMQKAFPQYLNSDFIYCIENQGSNCYLTSNCNAYTETLFQLSFKIQFAGNVNYLILPLAAFADDQGEDGCMIRMQNIPSTSDNPSQIVLGSMFFQLFTASFTSPKGAVNYAQTMVLAISKQNYIPGLYIQNKVSKLGTNPFTLKPNLVFPVTVSQDEIALFIKASFGNQGLQDFTYSILEQSFLTFALNATIQPYNKATPYFNLDYYNDITATNSSSGNMTLVYNTYQNVEVCLQTTTYSFDLCNLPAGQINVVREFKQPLTAYREIGAGNIGFNVLSQLWSPTMANLSSSTYNYLYIGYKNLTDWSWLEPNFKPLPSSVIDNNITISDKSIYPTTNQEYVFVDTSNTLGNFSFGWEYNDTSAYFEPLYTFNLVGAPKQPYAVFSTKEQGLGLTPNLFNKTKQLLKTISNGFITCPDAPNNGEIVNGGYCVLPGSCQHYSNMWNYSFRFQGKKPSNQAGIFQLPLAALAVNRAVVNNSSLSYECRIHISAQTKLNDFEGLGQTLDNTVVIGNMFFQSFEGEYQQNTVETTKPKMNIRINSLAKGTSFAGTLPNTNGQSTGPNPFAIPENIKIPDGPPLGQGLQSFSASVNGINKTSTGEEPYFYIDFVNSLTVVWAWNCSYQDSISGNQTSCSDYPTNFKTGFTPKTRAIKSFSNIEFSGYNVSGQIYFDYFCFGDVSQPQSARCQMMEIYSGELVTADILMFNQNGTYGVIGFGPYSKLWYQMIDYNSEIAKYSVQIQRLESNQTVNLGASQQVSSVNFSAGLPADYVDQPSLISYATFENDRFQYLNFQFGKVYYTADDVASQIYMQDLTCTEGSGTKCSPTYQFNINTPGLSLPSDLYSQFIELVADTRLQMGCNSTLGGSCTIPYACNGAPFNDLQEFSFNLYTNNSAFGINDTASNHINIPLGVFSQTGETADECIIMIQETAGENVVFGGMFFQELFGFNTNNFKKEQIYATTYVQQNLSFSNGDFVPYIGNRTLAPGPNPFVHKVNLLWLWITLIILTIILTIGGICYYRRRKQQEIFVPAPSISTDTQALLTDRYSNSHKTHTNSLLSEERNSARRPSFAFDTMTDNESMVQGGNAIN